MTYSSSHPDEINHFEKDAHTWWDPNGPFKILHRMNPCRLSFIREKIIHHFKADTHHPEPFQGLSILDIGCGGGLLSEPLARLGGRVTGIDAGQKNIESASFHAKNAHLPITYIKATPEELIGKIEPFDVITALEIVEHVTHPGQFMADCVALLKPGGLIFFSTLNKTLKAYALAILGAEYILKWVPQGSHQWEKFIRPSDLHQLMQEHGIRPLDLKGMSYNPLHGTWSLTHDLSINYIVVGMKDANFSL